MLDRSLAVLALVSLLVACSGETGPAGGPGATGPQGPGGPVGPPGSDGHSAWFTGAGVRIVATALDVSATGAAVEFQLTDAAGVPLDRAGLLTAGPVEVSFALAQLGPDGGEGTYTPYTTTVDTEPGGGTATQGAAESSGTIEVLDVLAGKYRYRCAAPLAGFDRTRTQTVVAVATRTFDGVG